MKGVEHDEELHEAKNAIRILGAVVEAEKDYVIPGTEIRHSAILIRKKTETPPKYPRRWSQIKKQPL